MSEEVQTAWMLPGVGCWFQDETAQEPFVLGTIEKLNGQQVSIKIGGKSQTVNVNQVLETNGSDHNHCEYNDCVDLDILNEPELLENSKQRFQNDKIFTYMGPTLMVMNPYKKIEELLGPQVLNRYTDYTLHSGSFSLKENGPHVYAIAGLAYRQMFENAQNQAIVISGESGAGKTENAKFAMQLLTSLSSGNKLQTGEIPIEDKILGCNPVLEAFGNAKTVRNDNSSRFGKYVRILVSKDQKKITGAAITNYLLEKSRICGQSDGERNYHIFYHFLKGASKEDLDRFYMSEIKMQDYAYINQTGCFDVNNINDQELYKEVVQSFNKLSFSKEDQDSVWSIIAAILLLGNVEIDASGYDESNPCKIKSKNELSNIAKLLKCDENALIQALIMKVRKVGGQEIESPMNLEDCVSSRDSLAKALYDRMFNWLVAKCNKTIMPQKMMNEQQGTRKSVKAVRKSIMGAVNTPELAIGLLDIFGFENFKVNSFEQLCINFTNEKLQQLYVSYVFKADEKEFQTEGIVDTKLSMNYKDNQQIIDLIDKYPMGILDLLDESSSLGSSTDKAFLEKIFKTHAKNTNLVVPKIIKESFTIIHTAKNVEYWSVGFRAKNKDELSDTFTSALEQTGNPIILEIFQGDKQKDANAQKKSKADKFLGSKFKVQINSLMTELQSCNVHFIRCIKPNEEKRALFFFAPFVLQQIRYLGVMESIKIRKQGFPFRKEYQYFFLQYNEIANVKKTSDHKANCAALLNEVAKDLVDQNMILWGKTKIYLRQEVSNRLDVMFKKIWDAKIAVGKRIIKQYKINKYRKILSKFLKHLSKKYKSFIRLQSYVKKYIQRKRYLKLLKAKKDREEKERIERERLAKLEQERLEKERLAKLEQERLEKEKQEIERIENARLEKERQEKEDKERLQKEELLKKEREAKMNADELAKQKAIEQQQKEEQQRQEKEQQLQKEKLEEQLKKEKLEEQLKKEKLKEQKIDESQQIQSEETNSQASQPVIQNSQPSQNDNNTINTANINRSFTQFDDQVLLDKKSSQIDNYTESFDDQSQQIQIQYSQDSLQNLEKIEPVLLNNLKQLDFGLYCQKVLQSGNFADMIYAKKLSKPLTSLDKTSTKFADQSFKLINEYIDQNDEEKQYQKIEKLLEIGFAGSDELKDEIYLQICKQINNPPQTVQLFRLYGLLAVVAVSFQPSLPLFLPLLNLLYLKKSQKREIEEGFVPKISYAFMKIIRSFDYLRKNPPSRIEVFTHLQLRQFNALIYLPASQSPICCHIESFKTVGAVKDFVMTTLGIQNRSKHYALQSQILADNQIVDERFCENKDNLLDVISENVIQLQSLIAKNKKVSYTCKITLKMRIFIKLKENDFDTLSMNFCQHLEDVLQGRFPLTQSDAVKLASLILHIKNPQFTDIKDSDLYKYYPLNILQADKKLTAKVLISQMIEQFARLAHLSKLQSKYLFLEVLQNYDLMTSHFFDCQQYEQSIGDDNSTGKRIGQVTLAIKPLQLLVLSPQVNKTITSYHYSQIKRWGCDTSGVKKCIVFITNDNYNHLFETPRAKEIENMFNNYCSLASGNANF